MEYVIAPKNNNDPMKHFQDISRIPRGSSHEKAASDFLVAYGKSLNHFVHQDDYLNVYIKKDGIGSGKNKEAILFQGHIDMVWEKNADTDFNFETEPLNLYVDNGYLKARGTTLGADNGVAIAYMMSMLADEYDSPPIECLFTTQEETGLDGAKNVDMTMFSAKKLINLDSGPEGVFLTSSAGGVRSNYSQNLERNKVPESYQPFNFNITGLKGGHSGMDIANEHGNALKIGARILYEMGKQLSIALVEFTGGEMDNAIPREVFIKAYVSEPEKANDLFIKIVENIKFEIAETEPEFTVNIDKTISDLLPIDLGLSNNIINFLYLMYSGPVHRNLSLDGLVVNSNNLAVVKTSENIINISTSTRSSIESLKTDLTNKSELLSKIFGFSYEHRADYPGWAYEANSPLRDELLKQYKLENNEDGTLLAIHAGLECGLLKAKKEDLDIVAIGPTAFGIHTPEEKLDINSFNRVGEFLRNFLKNQAK